MKLNKLLFGSLAAALLFGISIFPSCQKFEVPPMDFKPSDTANLSGPLVRMWAFEGDALDSVTSTKGVVTNVTFVDGKTGKAFQGASNGMIRVSPAGRLADLKSFTVAHWIKTGKHTGGAQCLWMLPRTSDFWGNMFLMIEGNSGDDLMQIKFNFAGQWLDFGGANKLANMYDRWVHLAFTYDGATSKVKMYIDGQQYTLPSGWEDRVSGGNPLGELAFKDVSGFVIGAFQQHLGSPWGNPDSWMLRYTGQLDQFRIYDYAMSAAEIAGLYNAAN